MERDLSNHYSRSGPRLHLNLMGFQLFKQTDSSCAFGDELLKAIFYYCGNGVHTKIISLDNRHHL